MPKRVSVDKWLFAPTLLLVAIGLIMVFSASALTAEANPNYHSAYYFLARQALWAALGVLAMFVLMNVDYRRYRAPAVILPLL
jgi:cell division protein FtsW